MGAPPFRVGSQNKATGYAGGSFTYDSMAKVKEQNQAVKEVLEEYHKIRKNDTLEKLAEMGLTKPELLP